MCTFNIALDDKVVNKARLAFRDDNTMTSWIEEQITILLSNYTALTEPKRKPHKHDTLMGAISGAPEIDYKHIHLKEKYGI